MSGWNPPPPPPPPPPSGMPRGPMPGPYAPFPPARKSSAGLVIGLVAAGLVVLVVIGVGAVLLLESGRRHTLTTPARAGGMTRGSVSGSALAPQITHETAIVQRTTDSRIGDIQTAVYGSGTERYLFIGGTGEFEPDELVRKFRERLKADEASGLLRSLTLPASTHGADGKMACASLYVSTIGRRIFQVDRTAMCVWSTTSTFGSVTPAPDPAASNPAISYSDTMVADITRRLRADLER